MSKKRPTFLVDVQVEGDSSSEEYIIPYEPTTTVTDVIQLICRKRRLNPEVWSFSTDKTFGSIKNFKLRDVEEKEMKLYVQRRRTRKKTYLLDHFEQLPSEFQRKILKAGISLNAAQKNLKVVLNILHFKTKHNFYTKEQYENRNKTKVRRRNTGPSLVDPNIVSVNSFEEEAGKALYIFLAIR
eukprot:TRINITY_DN1440_c0_g2_i3.p1 TRINITY_DN1440_c0_g2~~TRINITY_DN1440_c0_g2_i3.p1  ORF type:complete len:184 (-),score=32.36 TRINITY_DN1440_c0_g2_i3:228-779(-)